MILLIALGRGARADDTSVPLALDGCGDLDAQAVARLLRLELLVAPPPAEESPSVSVLCAADRWRIDASAPSGRRFSRDLPPITQAGRERTLALAISQVFFLLWREPIPTPSASASVSVDPLAPSSAAPPEPPRPRPAPEPSVEAAAGVNLQRRDLPDAYGTLGAALLVSYLLRPELRLLGYFRVDLGEASRSSGSIAARTAGVGAGLGARLPVNRWLSLDTSALLTAELAELKGSPSRDGVEGRAARGLGVDAAVWAGPTLLLGRFRAGISLQGGLTVPRLRGQIDRESSVLASGPWLGAGLWVGARLGEEPAP